MITIKPALLFRSQFLFEVGVESHGAFFGVAFPACPNLVVNGLYTVAGRAPLVDLERLWDDMFPCAATTRGYNQILMSIRSRSFCVMCNEMSIGAYFFTRQSKNLLSHPYAVRRSYQMGGMGGFSDIEKAKRLFGSIIERYSDVERGSPSAGLCSKLPVIRHLH